jgi:hypothetical protein
MKLIEYPSSTHTGWYDQLNDVVFINEKLKSFPILYDYVKEHELAHASHRFSYWYHLKLDIKAIRDRARYSQELKEFNKIKNKTDFKKDWKYYLFNIFYNSLFNFILIGYYIYNKWFSK